MKFVTITMKTKLASSLTLVVKINKVSLYAFDSTHTNLLHFWKRKKEGKKDSLKEMCHTGVDAKVLWKRRPTKPMSGKFPYYFLRGFFFFPTSRYEYCVAHGNIWIITASAKWSIVWSEAHQGENSASQTTVDSMKFGLCKYMTQK